MAYWGRNTHARLMCGAAMLALLGSGGVAAAEETAKFNIAPQPLANALNEFAVQSPWPILYTTTMTGGKMTAGVKDASDPEIALNTLLEGTGLGYRREGDTFLIVSAQDPQSGSAAGDGADGTVEALIVTAQKREEDIQDVPIAISAFSQEALERSQVAGGPDLMTQVPNMTFTKTNFSSYSIQLRGIGTQAISATVDPAVAVAFNNTPFIRNRFFEQEFYDLQRVEVLRGPQGTLYGRNATAGVVNLISRKPAFGYEAKLSADISNYNSSRIEGMLNVPLVEDKVALRIGGAWTKREGYSTNQITGNPIDGRDLWSARLSLRFAPIDTIEANLVWEHFEENDDRLRSGKQLCKRHLPETIGGLPVPWGDNQPGGGLYDQYFSQGCEAASLYSPDSFQAPVGLRLPYYRALSGIGLPIIQWNPDGSPFDPYASTAQSPDLRVIESTVDPGYRAKTDVAELQLSLDLTDDLTLSSETAYLADFIFSTQDYNRFNTRAGAFDTNGGGGYYIEHGILDENGVFCDPQIGCADRLVAVDLSTATSRQFSQEFRLSSNYDGAFNFSLGANFLRYDTEDKYYVFINTLSMYAAGRLPWMPDYVPGVTDNHQCLPRGMVMPNPNKVSDVIDCVYIDPNPIGSLNDLGHNYFLSRNPYKLISYAVFGEAYYNITEALKVTAGLRWTVDKKEAPRIPSWVLGANSVGYPVAEIIEQEWSEPTGRLTLDWKPDLSLTDETLLYASYAHGYKAGGANPPAAGLALYTADASPVESDWDIIAQQQSAVAPRVFEPEFVEAFELGTKNTFLDGRATLNAAAFYYDYQGYQISQIVNRSAVNLNFDAEVWGLEIEADWRPLENLRFGFKGGYEKTRMADGSKAIDVMDRTAGNPDWFVAPPFPTLPSNCILPTYMVARPDELLQVLSWSDGGNLGPCEVAYTLGLDPFTNQEYVANPPMPTEGSAVFSWYDGYPGFDPESAPNGGAGFYKDLSGNELPNAPQFTATITADYTLPLPNDWLATLHTDLYYQSEAWTRVFNTEGYDKLKAYTNVNLAAIFTQENLGWKVMAYVKNVFDRDSITGAFLNSDDTGLTTNVFLTEPRLYGLRVTKEFQGGPWWTGANPGHTKLYPLTVEVSGQVQRHDADYTTLRPELFDAFPKEEFDHTSPQHRNLDWGDGRELKLTWRPRGSSWSVAAAVRYGRTNTGTTWEGASWEGDEDICAGPMFIPFIRARCDPDYSFYGGPPGQYYNPSFLRTEINSASASADTREYHTIVDFEVGHDVGLGGLASTISAGIRYADISSDTKVWMTGIPDTNFPEGWAFKYSTHTQYEGQVKASREFTGAGPVLEWEAGLPLLGGDDTGRLGIDWSIAAGVLFGKRETSVVGDATTTFYQRMLATASQTFPQAPIPYDLTEAPRSTSASVPVVDLSLGLSYDVGRIKVGAGYRWERYFDVLDVGYDEHQDADRTIDGPYFKLSVGFGG